MAGVGTLIRASEFNAIQSSIALNLGTGSSTRGYGQALVSAQVSAGDRITVSQWANLRTDLLKARQHQTGNDESANLTVPSSSLTVTEALRSQYATMASTIDTDRFSIASNQLTVENVITPATRSAAWNGTISNVVTISFSSFDHARYFFNSGGHFRISSSRSGGSSSSKNNTWTTMFDQSGNVIFGKDGTSSTGSSPGTSYGIGFHNVTTSDQVIYWKPAPSGVYAENDYYVYARRSADWSQIIITSEYRDDDTGDQQGGYLPGPQVDENVDGTLTNTIQMQRATGSNVSVSAPSASQTGM